MRELFACANVGAEFRSILARRWWMILLAMAIAAAAVAGLEHLHTASALRLEELAAVVCTIPLWFFIYADVRRAEDPTFALDAASFWMLVLIGFGKGLCAIAIYVPALILANLSHQPQLLPILVGVGLVFLQARLMFVYFAAEEPEGAFNYSWRVSRGRAYLPSLVLAAFLSAFEYARVGLVDVAAVQGGATAIAMTVGEVAIVVTQVAWGYPWMLRWMRVAQTMQPALETTAG